VPPPFFWGGGRVGSLSSTKSPGTRPTSIPSGILIHPAVWPQQTWAENWRCIPLGAGSPSNTMWSGQRPICTPSFILIIATIWPQYTNVTDRQDRTDNGPIAYRANRFTNGRPKTIYVLLGFWLIRKYGILIKLNSMAPGTVILQDSYALH